MVWAAAPLVAYWGSTAVARCHEQMAGLRAAARRRAALARVIENHRHAWAAGTTRMAAILEVAEHTPAAGFGDLLVAEERLRVAAEATR